MKQSIIQDKTRHDNLVYLLALAVMSCHRLFWRLCAMITPATSLSSSSSLKIAGADFLLLVIVRSVVGQLKAPSCEVLHYGSYSSILHFNVQSLASFGHDQMGRPAQWAERFLPLAQLSLLSW